MILVQLGQGFSLRSGKVFRDTGGHDKLCANDRDQFTISPQHFTAQIAKVSVHWAYGGCCLLTP